jgi:type II secretory pathway pseudopilin PulG
MSAKDSLLVALGLFGILYVIALTSGVGRVRRSAARGSSR